MFKSIAVLALISNASAVRVRSQFYPMEFDDDEQIMTQDSIQQAERIHGTEFSLNEHTYKNSLVENNHLGFGDDGQTFDKIFKIKNSMESPRAPVPEGVTMLQSRSDPIWGSLGVPKIAKGDLTPEQQFEQSQRNMKVPELKDSEDVITTNNSIKVAEGIVKGKMPNPSDPKELDRMKNAAINQVEYHLHGDDEEDEDTVETRRSVKTVEKRMKHRFFINARERKDYEEQAAQGKISAKELGFAEGEDDDIGKKPEDEINDQKKEAEKKKELVEKEEDVKKKEKESVDSAAGAGAEGAAGAKEGAKGKDGKGKGGKDKAKGGEEDFIPPELLAPPPAAGGADAAAPKKELGSAPPGL